jgi:hypothetical protein
LILPLKLAQNANDVITAMELRTKPPRARKRPG